LRNSAFRIEYSTKNNIGINNYFHLTSFLRFLDHQSLLILTALDVDLAKSVGDYFQLRPNEMDKIINDVHTTIRDWKGVAKEIGISRADLEIMAPAFRI
jgi:hypothetical protein